jgi:hypothetical protein
VRKFSRRTTVISVGLALVVATSVIAFAFWTGIGSGSGSASAGDTASPLTVNQVGVPTGLVPGGPAATLSGNFDNPNPSGVFVNQVTATIASVTPGADNTKPACTANDFKLGGPAVVNAEVPSGNGVGSWTGITLQLLNTNANQDNCKNAVVSISYAIN